MRGQLARLVQMERKEFKGEKAIRAIRESRGYREKPDLLVSKVFKGRWGILGNKEYRVRGGYKERREKRVIREHPVSKEFRGHKG